MNEKDSNVRDVADAVKGIVEAVPIYQDTIQPAAREVGVALQTVAKTIHIALAPIRVLVWGYEQIGEYVTARLAEKLKDKPADEIVTPPPNVAGPAIEALRFAGQEADLREMYASLLATAMDIHRTRKAHPAFVEIIRQLTSDEARLLRYFMTSGVFPLISIRSEKKNGEGGITVLRHFSLLGEKASCQISELTSSYIDNLCRLGLVEIPFQYRYSTPGIYDEVRNHPTVMTLIAEIDSQDEVSSQIQEHILILTAIGKQFSEACFA